MSRTLAAFLLVWLFLTGILVGNVLCKEMSKHNHARLEGQALGCWVDSEASRG